MHGEGKEKGNLIAVFRARQCGLRIPLPSCDYTPGEFERVGIGVSCRIEFTCNQRASYACDGLCEPEAVDTESEE